MIKLSAVIITYNEERNIGRCIDSLNGIADEVFILDSFSNDRTVEIAKAKGARVAEHAFAGYIEQKNLATQLAEFDHILSLDADEALDDAMRQSVLAAKQHWAADAYSFNRLTNYCGKWIRHCGWYPDRKLRLFDRRKCSWKGVNPHDRLEFDSAGSLSTHLDGDILHYSYYTIDEHRRQTERFTTIAARALFKKGKKDSVIKRFLSPVAKFLKDYIFNLGFLDGYYGWTICRISAYATYLKYHKLSLMNRGKWHE
ncbi:MAG: glycosyltransferase family 2 protein [Bacteroidota bacterium]